MEWPVEIVSAFSEAIDVTPIPFCTKEKAIEIFLDGAAKIAVDRASGDPTKLLTAYQIPMTPIGQMTANFFDNSVESLSIGPNWTAWSFAIDRLYRYIEANSEEITARFVGMLNRDSGPQGTSSEAQRS